MAGTGKYANLPDLDIAPDVYETPDLADDISTIQDTSAHSPSIDEDNADGNDHSDDASGIDRRKVATDEARGRFQHSRAAAHGSTFIDSAVGSAKHYRASNARRKQRYVAGLGEASSSESEDESLDQRLIRLRREIEEVKVVIDESQSSKAPQQSSPSLPATPGAADQVQLLSDALDTVYDTSSLQRDSIQEIFLRNLWITEPPSEQAVTPEKDIKAAPAQVLPSEPHLSRVLAKAAEFDERLTLLEHALGLDASHLPDQGQENFRPILQMLDHLQRQIEILSNAPDTVDMAKQSTKQLLKEVERLQRPRAGQDSITKPTAQSTQSEDQTPSQGYTITVDQLTRINALYGALPTIDTLSPSIPLILERLRTLQTMHASAAAASQTLDDIEQRQNEQEMELKHWRTALDKLEASLKDGEGALTENLKSVSDWVKSLENRVRRFS